MLTVHTMNGALMRKLPYDTLNDFSAIALIATTPFSYQARQARGRASCASSSTRALTHRFTQGAHRHKWRDRFRAERTGLGSIEVNVLDTHILGRSAASASWRARCALIDQNGGAGKIAVSALTFWEVGLLHEPGRLQLPAVVSNRRSELIATGLMEIPVDGTIAVRALDHSSLPGDPTDRFIAATALVHGAALMTADEKLFAWQHALVRHDGTS